MLIWRTDLREPLNVRCKLNNEGSGHFELFRFAQNAYQRAGGSDGFDQDGEALFGFSAEQLAAWQWRALVLRLTVTAYHPGDADMSLFLLLDQPGGRLRAEDALGNEQPTQTNGVELRPTLKHNDARFFDFRVYFW